MPFKVLEIRSPVTGASMRQDAALSYQHEAMRSSDKTWARGSTFIGAVKREFRAKIGILVINESLPNEQAAALRIKDNIEYFV